MERGGDCSGFFANTTVQDLASSAFFSEFVSQQSPREESGQ